MTDLLMITIAAVLKCPSVILALEFKSILFDIVPYFAVSIVKVSF